MNEEIKKLIDNEISSNEVCLFMKGTPDAPQCGFSMAVSNILKILDVKFVWINGLENESLRQAIKEYSDWPTIPQLYVKKEFVGGCDIIKEMYENGELSKLLESQELRQGIKEYSDWPTIPQLYIKKEFVGGCDIVKEMYENGELKKILQDKNLIS